MDIESVKHLVGQTPIISLDFGTSRDVRIHFKMEGFNPTGSIKDRAAFYIIREKIKSGELTKDKKILDASSGSFACAMAYFGKILGYQVVTVTGDKMTTDKLNFVNYFGGNNIKFNGKFTIDSNRYCSEKLISEYPNEYCFLDQLHNWNNPLAHYETTGPEILNSLPNLQAVAFSIGSGGTLCGLSEYIKEKKEEVKIIGVTADKGTKIPGTAAFLDGEYETPFIKKIFNNNWLDFMPNVSYDDASYQTLQLRDKGLYVGIQTGAVFQGMLDAIEELNLSGDILIISGDAGWKNSDKLKSISVN